MSNTMRAIEISEPGGPEVLREVIRHIPQLGAGEVLIKVAAAGINRPDCLQRAGLYPVPEGASDLPGLEVAGEIIELGEGVSRWQVGDMVCALTPGGGYAEYCVAPQGHCLPIPQGLTAVEAAAIVETTFTVYSNVWMRAALKQDESLLVHGGSSGIGSTAIQIAKAAGHFVAVTAGSDEKCQFCTALGADIAINYKTGDWAEQLATAKPQGVDVILDMVAGDYTQKNLDALAVDGRLSIIALIRGAQDPNINLGTLMRKRLTMAGSTLRPQSISAKTRIASKIERDIWPLYSVGGVVPMIYETFMLAEAYKAHELMESGAHMGKIVLEVS